MERFLRWPYDEVTATLNESEKSLFVKTPWVAATVGMTDEALPAARELVEKISGGSLAPGDIGLISWFFGRLANFPFCYILPTKKSAETLDVLGDLSPELDLTDFRSLLLTAIKTEPNSKINYKKIEAAVESLPRQTFAWDWESASTFSKTQEGVHPESFFSVSRRYHLLDVLANNLGAQVFDKIKKLSKDEFRKAAGLVVKQNHYVTECCQAALSPAIKKAGQAKTKVEAFIREEYGHDRLLGAAVKALSEDPENVSVSPVTEALMFLLEFTARHNFLAFTMAVDCFERSAYQKTDPLAALLRHGGFEMAAKQVNRHMEINDSGGHENVAMGMLEFLAPVRESVALQALRIVEVISVLANHVAQSAWEIYESEN